MKKAMTDAKFPSFGCFAHTLQLIVNDGILLQAGVVQLLAICRKIVGHFKHSTVAYHEIQERLSLPPHHLQQDVKTKCNSSLYMVKSIIDGLGSVCYGDIGGSRMMEVGGQRGGQKGAQSAP